MTFDLDAVRDLGEIQTVIEAKKTIRTPGRMDGVCFYFRARFDDEIALATSPAGTRTNWGNLMFRTEGKRYEANDVISYRLTMKDPARPGTWSFSLL